MSTLRQRNVNRSVTRNSKDHNSTELRPDCVLVFSGKSNDVSTNVSKAVDTLVSEGFYVAVRKGAAGSVLLLVRLSNKTYENAVKCNIDSSEVNSRPLLVQKLLPWTKLDGCSDNFAVISDPPNILSSSLVLSEESLNSIESIYGGRTAAAFEMSNYLIHALVQISICMVLNNIKNVNLTHNAVSVLLVGIYFVATWSSYAEPVQKVTPSTLVQVNRKEYGGTAKSVREFRKLLFIPLAILLLGVYALGLTVVFVFEVFCTHIYDGPAKSIVGLLPIGANIVASEIYVFIYNIIICRFTAWEDYPTEQELSQVIAQRSFYLRALLGYFPIILTAYVYLPFGPTLAADLMPLLHSSIMGKYVNMSSVFRLDKYRLLNQAFFYSATQQAISVVIESFSPFFVVFVKRNIFKQVDASPDDFAIEQLRPPFDTDAYISNLVLAFGYILILTPIRPLASLSFLISLYLRSKVYLYMLMSTKRKSKPSYTRSLGFWNNNLRFILALSSVITSTIAYMYGPSSEFYTNNTNVLDISWGSVVSVAFVVENSTLLCLYVLSTYFKERVPSKSDGKQHSQVNVDSLDSGLEEIWESNDVYKELSAVLKT